MYLSAPARAGGWMQTFKGIQFWPMDPRPEEVDIEDIAHALSNMCRFGGHTKSFYSVAQHSCIVSDNLPFGLSAQGLLHDATEAYLVDVPTPIKRFLVGYKEFEAGLARVIGERFDVELVHLAPETHEADVRALWTEKRDLKGPQPARWPIEEHEPYPSKIRPWGPARAKEEFLCRARELGLYA